MNRRVDSNVPPCHGQLHFPLFHHVFLNALFLIQETLLLPSWTLDVLSVRGGAASRQEDFTIQASFHFISLALFELHFSLSPWLYSSFISLYLLGFFSGFVSLYFLGFIRASFHLASLALPFLGMDLASILFVLESCFVSMKSF